MKEGFSAASVPAARWRARHVAGENPGAVVEWRSFIAAIATFLPAYLAKSTLPRAREFKPRARRAGPYRRDPRCRASVHPADEKPVARRVTCVIPASAVGISSRVSSITSALPPPSIISIFPASPPAGAGNIGSGDKRVADIFFAPHDHAWLDDQRGVISVILHQCRVILLGDSAIAGFDGGFKLWLGLGISGDP